jgi:hypothetical protein
VHRLRREWRLVVEFGYEGFYFGSYSSGWSQPVRFLRFLML